MNAWDHRQSRCHVVEALGCSNSLSLPAHRNTRDDCAIGVRIALTTTRLATKTPAPLSNTTDIPVLYDQQDRARSRAFKCALSPSFERAPQGLLSDLQSPSMIADRSNARTSPPGECRPQGGPLCLWRRRRRTIPPVHAAETKRAPINARIRASAHTCHARRVLELPNAVEPQSATRRVAARTRQVGDIRTPNKRDCDCPRRAVRQAARRVISSPARVL